MFSGKTSTLIDYLKKNNDKNCIALKHTVDNRYDENNINSHDGKIYMCTQVSKLMDHYENLKKYDIIGIDEGQFFEDLPSFCKKFHENYGDDFVEKIIIISSLNSDFMTNPWPSTSNTLPYVTKIKILKSKCALCSSKNAIFTSRKNSSTSKIEVGGAEMYHPLCSQCYFSKLSK